MIGWNLHPRVWAVLAIAVVVEGLTLVGVIAPMVTLEFIELPWALPLVAVALPFLRQSPPNFNALPVAVGSVLVALGFLGAYLLSSTSSPDTILAIVLTAVLEETIFRVALPGLLAILLIWAGLRPPVALVVALVAAAGSFATMPGHLAQMDEPQMISVFLAFAVLMTYVVWRGRFLWPAVVAHASIDFFTLAYQDGRVSAAQRALGVLACLLAMVFLTVNRANRRDALARQARKGGEQTVIDLRDPADAITGSNKAHI